MASGGDNEGCPELADAPASFKSGVWEHFGFHVRLLTMTTEIKQ